MGKENDPLSFWYGIFSGAVYQQFDRSLPVARRGIVHLATTMSTSIAKGLELAGPAEAKATEADLYT